MNLVLAMAGTGLLVAAPWLAPFDPGLGVAVSFLGGAFIAAAMVRAVLPVLSGLLTAHCVAFHRAEGERLLRAQQERIRRKADQIGQGE